MVDSGRKSYSAVPSMDASESNTDSERLLDNRSDSISSENNKEREDFFDSQRYKSSRLRTYKLVTVFLTLTLLATNIAWYWTNSEKNDSPQTVSSVAPGPVEQDYYLGEHDARKIYMPISHDWEDLQESEVVGEYRYADEHWDNYFPKSGGAVSVTHEFQVQHGLDRGATPTKDDPSKYHYIVAGFHQIHCLSVLRDVIYQQNGTLPDQNPIIWDHILHCVEAVRQALQCFLDPTLIPLDKPWPGLPNGQMHVCRNSDALFSWTNKNHHDLPDYVEPFGTPHTQEWLVKHAQHKALNEGEH